MIPSAGFFLPELFYQMVTPERPLPQTFDIQNEICYVKRKKFLTGKKGDLNGCQLGYRIGSRKSRG